MTEPGLQVYSLLFNSLQRAEQTLHAFYFDFVPGKLAVKAGSGSINRLKDDLRLLRRHAELQFGYGAAALPHTSDKKVADFADTP